MRILKSLLVLSVGAVWHGFLISMAIWGISWVFGMPEYHRETTRMVQEIIPLEYPQ